jgi:hypothetical protein
MLITGTAAGSGARGRSAGLLAVGALAFGGWMLGRVRSRRHEPHSAEA